MASDDGVPTGKGMNAINIIVFANVVALVSQVLGVGSRRDVRLEPIAIYANGKFADAVSDHNDPRHRESPLDWTHHFLLVSRGLRVASADVTGVFVPPASSGSPCSRTVLAYGKVVDPLYSDNGVALLPGLAVSEYTAVRGSLSAPARTDPRFGLDVLAAAATALAQAGKYPRRGPNLMDLHVQSMDVMDVYHDGQPEVFARVLGGGNFTFIWLAYVEGKATLLHAETVQAAGGNDAGPNLVDTADIDGDGVDEVVIEEVGDSSTQFEIYRVTRHGVKRVFQGGNYGC
jgi:hypothetical protein